MSLKRIKLQDGDWNEVVLAVDYNNPKLAEILEEFMKWHDVYSWSACFERIANKALTIAMTFNYNPYGVAHVLEKEEGFFPVRGEYGVVLVDCDIPEYRTQVVKIEDLQEMPEPHKGNL